MAHKIQTWKWKRLVLDKNMTIYQMNCFHNSGKTELWKHLKKPHSFTGLLLQSPSILDIIVIDHS